MPVLGSATGISGFARPHSRRKRPASKVDPAPSSSGAPVITYTLYNEAAYSHIRSNRLNRVAELKRLQVAGEPDSEIVNDRSVPPFPSEAVILKTVWWPVAQHARTALPVWDTEPIRRERPGVTT